jgi:hypothetical protein
MKNILFILCLVFAFIGTTQAQINRYRLPQYPQTPLTIDLRFNCADIAAFLQIYRIDKISGNNFKVVIKVTIKNVGRVDFNDRTHPIIASMGPTSNYPNPREDAVSIIPELRVGASKVIYLTLPWSANWQVRPNVELSINANRADCNPNNNQASVTHHAILQSFRRKFGGGLPFGRF